MLKAGAYVAKEIFSLRWAFIEWRYVVQDQKLNVLEGIEDILTTMEKPCTAQVKLDDVPQGFEEVLVNVVTLIGIAYPCQIQFYQRLHMEELAANILAAVA